MPPITPNPFPEMKAGEEDYAHVEGITVWEATVSVLPPEGQAGKGESHGSPRVGEPNHNWETGERLIIRRTDGWEAVWRGEVPVGESCISIERRILLMNSLRPNTNTEPVTCLDGVCDAPGAGASDTQESRCQYGYGQCDERGSPWG
jgi:hypothetical protein